MFSDEIKKFFDLWITYHLEADIFLPYFTYEYKTQLLAPPKSKDPDKKICMFVSSPINKSGRKRYLEELTQYLDIDSYGRWENNCKILDDKGYTSKMEVISRYK